MYASCALMNHLIWPDWSPLSHRKEISASPLRGVGGADSSTTASLLDTKSDITLGGPMTRKQWASLRRRCGLSSSAFRVVLREVLQRRTLPSVFWEIYYVRAPGIRAGYHLCCLVLVVSHTCASIDRLCVWLNLARYQDAAGAYFQLD